MKKFFTFILLSACILALIDEKPAAENIPESQKSNLVITTDKGQSIKINTDDNSHFRPVGNNFVQKSHGRRNLDESSEEVEAEEVSALLKELQNDQSPNKDGEYCLTIEQIDDVISKLNSYEEDLEEKESSDSSSGSTGEDSDSDDKEKRKRRRHKRHRVMKGIRRYAKKGNFQERLNNLRYKRYVPN